MRIMSYAAEHRPRCSLIAGTGPTPWLYDDRLRMVGVKLYLDGALGSRGAWLKAALRRRARPTRPAAGQRHALRKNLMSRAAMDGFQVAIHAIGDAANAAGARARSRSLPTTYKGDRRWRIEHAQIVDPADLPRFARHGIIASMQPVHQTSDRRMAEARLGPERLGGAYAWRSMIDDAGVPLAFGSDFPVEAPNPFHGLAVAISREDAQGQPPGGWQPEQKVTLDRRLSPPSPAAPPLPASPRTGSARLERGRYADFLFLDRDIFTATPARNPGDAGAGDLGRRQAGLEALAVEAQD